MAKKIDERASAGGRKYVFGQRPSPMPPPGQGFVTLPSGEKHILPAQKAAPEQARWRRELQQRRQVTQRRAYHLRGMAKQLGLRDTGRLSMTTLAPMVQRAIAEREARRPAPSKAQVERFKMEAGALDRFYASASPEGQEKIKAQVISNPQFQNWMPYSRVLQRLQLEQFYGAKALTPKQQRDVEARQETERLAERKQRLLGVGQEFKRAEALGDRQEVLRQIETFDLEKYGDVTTPRGQRLLSLVDHIKKDRTLDPHDKWERIQKIAYSVLTGKELPHEKEERELGEEKAEMEKAEAKETRTTEAAERKEKITGEQKALDIELKQVQDDLKAAEAYHKRATEEHAAAEEALRAEGKDPKGADRGYVEKAETDVHQLREDVRKKRQETSKLHRDPSSLFPDEAEPTEAPTTTQPATQPTTQPAAVQPSPAMQDFERDTTTGGKTLIQAARKHWSELTPTEREALKQRLQDEGWLQPQQR